MTREQQRLADYLSHVLQAIERINLYTEGLDETFRYFNRKCKN